MSILSKNVYRRDCHRKVIIEWEIYLWLIPPSPWATPGTSPHPLAQQVGELFKVVLSPEVRGWANKNKLLCVHGYQRQ